MKTVVAVQAVPGLAQVNLLPQEIREARTLSVVKRWVAASVGLTLFSVGTVAAVAHIGTQIADSGLSQANAETTQLLAQQQPFAEVNTVRAELQTVRSAQSFAMSTEILWADLLGSLVGVTPQGVGISTLEYAGATPLMVAPASTDPLVAPGLGTVAFTALARDLPDTAAWAEAIDGVPGFSDARIDTAAMEPNIAPGYLYSVSGTFQVDEDALSHRFDAQPEATR